MTILRALFSIAIVATAACSGGTSSSPTSPTPPVSNPSPAPPPSGPPTVAITAAGMTPLEITINVGQRVTFVNNDVRSHDIVGGIDPARPECPEILVFLTPGQRSETGTFTSARTCEYHDHAALGVPGFQGRIIIR